MTVYTFNPLADSRWEEFVRTNPGASVFHTAGWVDALSQTYVYEPVVYTTCAPDAELTNGILLCRIRSWLTGRRMVSLPFSDHCEPLVERPEDREDLLTALQCAAEKERWQYVELRPRHAGLWEGPFQATGSSFVLHMLDLRPGLDDLFARTHRSMIQRKIRRAEREALYYEEGRSEPLLNKFYDLLLLTRRRHRLPPQPIRWFRHLIACLGDRLKIRVASKDGRHIAAIMTLQHGRTLTYKYGCSDADFHKLGAVPFLLWKTIQDAKAVGAQTLDLGRSDSDNAGLIAFKERWGATPSALTYVRLPARRLRRGQGPGAHVMQAAGLVLARMPARLSVTAGRLLYPHIG